jgi:tetratricopeptide (TPR) repeat protein
MLVFRGIMEHFHHDFASAERTFLDARAIGAEGYVNVQFEAAMWLGTTYVTLDRHAEAAPLLAEAERLSNTVDSPFAQAWWAFISGTSAVWKGRFADALAVLERWKFAITASGQVGLSLWLGWLEGLACAGAGKYQRALSRLHEALASAKRVGDPLSTARILNTIGFVHSELGDVERAFEWNSLGVDAARQIRTPDPEITSNALLNVADNLMQMNRMAEAEQTLREVAQLIDSTREQDPYLLWRYSMHFYCTNAELHLIKNDFASALGATDECLRIANRSKSQKYVVKARRMRGRIFATTGHTVEANRELTMALEEARQLGNPLERWRTLNTLEELSETLGIHSEAVQAFRREAADAIQEVAEDLTDSSLRAVFLSRHSRHGERKHT